MRKATRVIPIVAGTSLAGLACLYWVQSDRNAAIAVPPVREPSPVNDRAVLFSAPGVTEPQSRTVQIFSEISGTVRAIHVSAGDRVRKGQLLVELESDIQKSSVDLARAVLDRAQADLTRLRNGEREQERAIAKARLDEAEASLRLAQFEWQRVEKMTKQSAASDKEVADARAALELAKARRDAAKGQWDLSVAGPRPEDITRGEAAVREAEAQLSAARSMVEKMYLRSPIDGIVIYRFREPGEAVFTDKPAPILTVGDRSRLYVRADVDEIDIANVHVGQAAYATAPAYGDKRFHGRVVHIEPTLGRKNFRTNRPTEKLDTKVQEVVVALDDADEVPIELQMVVWFLKTTAAPTPVVAGGR